jgi:hypothetical protein
VRSFLGAGSGSYILPGRFTRVVGHVRPALLRVFFAGKKSLRLRIGIILSTVPVLRHDERQ